MNDANFIWDMIVEKLSSELTPTAINTWITPCDPVAFNGSQLVLRTPDEFRKKILTERFSPIISSFLKELLPGDDIGLILLTGEDQYTADSKGSEDEGSLPLIPGYSFDDFIVGPSNKFAHAASIAVSENPGVKFNPLFIYGNSGLGKTHLMLAIGYSVQKKKPRLKVVYEKGESFMNKLIHAIKEGTTEAFHDKYRNVDILLIDDIQFIAGKQSTQNEFFHTFNDLHQARHQIVITSDRPPIEMTLLDDRLRTRFEGGLMADIAPPDLETRIAIAKSKAALIDLKLSDDDFVYIATKIKSNVRTLEGLLNQLGAFSSIMNTPVTRALIDELIEKIIVASGAPTADVIIREASRYYSLTPEQLKSENRSRNINTARQVAMYLMRTMTSMSFQDIGASLKRNHSTAMNSVGRIDDQLKTDPKLRSIIRDIEANITNAPSNPG